jgi:DNA-binding response OmpR family regulator
MRTPEIRFDFPFIWIDGEMLELLPKQFRLLEYLYEHRGELKRAFDIYVDVWKLPSPVIRTKGEGAIATAISRIRVELPEVIIARSRGLGWVLV